jgi:hypothetical protein
MCTADQVTMKERTIMKRLIVIAATLMIAFGMATPVVARETVPFQAELHHFTAPAGTCEAGVCLYTSQGFGTVNIMGTGAPFVSVAVELRWDFTTSPCSTIDPLELTLVGATGSIDISGSGSYCPGLGPSGFPQYFSGVGEITGGTGEFSGITGTVTTINGPVGPNGPVLHLSGTASY